MIDEEYILRIDRQLMNQGVPVHARPFRVVVAYMQDHGIVQDILRNEYWPIVNSVYAKRYDRQSLAFPPLLVGGVSFGDQFYTARVSIGYGTFAIRPLETIDIESARLDQYWRDRPDDVHRAIYSVADLWDFGYATRDLGSGDTGELLNRAGEAIEMSAQSLKSGLGLDATVQTSCLAAELSLKGVLTHLGWDEAKRRNAGHNLLLLAKAVAELKPSPTDKRLEAVLQKFPNFVQSRYSSTGLTRIELNELALRAQFVAADATRRVSERNLGARILKEGPPRSFP